MKHHNLDHSENPKFDELAVSNTSSTKFIVGTPQVNDILCGRGQSIEHPGNQRFRRLIECRKEEYQRSKRRQDKTRITAEIVDNLCNGSEPSRFLLKDPNSEKWYDAGEKYGREKVSHALRSKPNEEKRQQQKSNKRRKRFNNQKGPNNNPVGVNEKVKVILADQQLLLKSLIDKN